MAEEYDDQWSLRLEVALQSSDLVDGDVWLVEAWKPEAHVLLLASATVADYNDNRPNGRRCSPHCRQIGIVVERDGEPVP